MRELDDLLNDLRFIDEVVGYMLPGEIPELYLAGGSACILAGYLSRATKDFDLINIGYGSRIGKVLNYLQPYDLLDITNAELSSDFRDRAVPIGNFKNIRVFAMSREDIIASKIGRFSEKDRMDIQVLMTEVDMELLKICIKATMANICNINRIKRYLIHLEEFLQQYDIKMEMNRDV